jgi:hypothetical protein
MDARSALRFRARHSLFVVAPDARWTQAEPDARHLIRVIPRAVTRRFQSFDADLRGDSRSAASRGGPPKARVRVFGQGTTGTLNLPSPDPLPRRRSSLDRADDDGDDFSV